MEPYSGCTNITNRPNVHARLVTPNVLEMWPCYRISSRFIKFEQNNDLNLRYEFLSVSINMSGRVYEAFIDSVKVDIQAASQQKSFISYRSTILKLNNILWQLDQLNGLLLSASDNEILVMNSSHYFPTFFLIILLSAYWM